MVGWGGRVRPGRDGEISCMETTATHPRAESTPVASRAETLVGRPGAVVPDERRPVRWVSLGLGAALVTLGSVQSGVLLQSALGEVRPASLYALTACGWVLGVGIVQWMMGVHLHRLGLRAPWPVVGVCALFAGALVLTRPEADGSIPLWVVITGTLGLAVGGVAAVSRRPALAVIVSLALLGTLVVGGIGRDLVSYGVIGGGEAEMEPLSPPPLTTLPEPMVAEPAGEAAAG